MREGGLVAFITSQGVMNSASPFVRAEMVKRADLVAALRLPNNTFSDNAVWVCADTRVGAYHILRKCREILVGGCLAVTVNNRLHEKFLVSRQCGFTAMLLEDNQVTACV